MRRAAIVIMFALVFVWTSKIPAQDGAHSKAQENAQLQKNITSPTLDDLLWSLPADTETLIVAHGPFLMPEDSSEKELGKPHSPLTPTVSNQTFQILALGMLLRVQDGKIAMRLHRFPVTLGLEGARHFRSPNSLGLMPYQGCHFAVFKSDLGTVGDALMKSLESSAVRIENVEGQHIAVFQEKEEEDIWNIFVVRPRPNVLLGCTDRGYLTEVLNRIGHRETVRALPNDLPEWKQVDINSKYWGLRHYDHSQAADDPSSPFGGQKAANDPDEKAVGVVFYFDPSAGRTAAMRYLSQDDEKLLKVANRHTIVSEPEQGVKLNVEVSHPETGVLEYQYNLKDTDSLTYFQFDVLGFLGHGIYL